MARNDDPDSLTTCLYFFSFFTSGPFLDRKEGLGLLRKEFWFLIKSFFLSICHAIVFQKRFLCRHQLGIMRDQNFNSGANFEFMMSSAKTYGYL